MTLILMQRRKIYSSGSWGSSQVVPDAGMDRALPLSLVAPEDGAVISMSFRPLPADSTHVAAPGDLATRTTAAAPTQTAATPAAASQCSGPGVLEVPGVSARGAGFGAAASAPVECGPETFSSEDALWPLAGGGLKYLDSSMGPMDLQDGCDVWACEYNL